MFVEIDSYAISLLVLLFFVTEFAGYPLVGHTGSQCGQRRDIMMTKRIQLTPL